MNAAAPPAAPRSAGFAFGSGAGWIRRGRGGVLWHVHPAWERALFDAGDENETGNDDEPLPFAAWRARGALDVVKSGPHREVCRVRLEHAPKPEPGAASNAANAAGAVYIKHFRVPNWRARIRQWMRRGKGRNEALRALRLARAGIDTVEPIALGERRRFGLLLDNYLVTRERPDSLPLDEVLERRMPAWPPEDRARFRHRVARALAELTARLHVGGMVHDDFHPGNVLVDTRDLPDADPETGNDDGDGDGDDPADRAGGVRLALVDLDALRFRGTVGDREARRNLAKLDHYFFMRGERTDRIRFLSHYRAARAALGEAPQSRAALRAEAAAIHAATRAWAERLWTRWGRRCLGENKYFRVLRAPGRRAFVSRALDDATAQAWLRDPEAWFARPEFPVLKQSKSGSVVLGRAVVFGREIEVVGKRFPRRAWWEPVAALVRPPRARRAWIAAQHCLARNIPTPRNLMLLERAGPFGLVASQDLWMMAATPGRTLRDYLERDWTAVEDPDRRGELARELARELGRLLRDLHERSLSHRDLKASNILALRAPDEDRPGPDAELLGHPLAIAGGRPDPGFALAFIDLVGLALEHPLPEDRRIQNLARLAVSCATLPGWSRASAARFLREYARGAPRGEWKRIWREVASRARAKLEQNAKRGRRIS